MTRKQIEIIWHWAYKRGSFARSSAPLSGTSYVSLHVKEDRRDDGAKMLKAVCPRTQFKETRSNGEVHFHWTK